MPKSIKKILKEYNEEVLFQKSDESLTFGASINELFKDKTKPENVKVPGLDTDDSGASAGRADFLIGQIKNNLRGLGFDVNDLDKQKTIAQLIPSPFGLKFSLIWPKENEWGEKSYVTLSVNGQSLEALNIDTRAKVKEPNANGKLVLSTKLGPDIIFIDPKELERTLGGGEGKLPPGKKGENYKRLLEEGVTYKVQIDSDIIVGGESSTTTEEEPIVDIPIPEEVASGKNRNEIFRLLLKGFGKYSGEVVYGDGFSDPEMARTYTKLQRDVRAGKEDKEKLKEFREKANRDSYSMMVSNLRKSFPNNFLTSLSKAFPEFNIKFSKQSVGESLNSEPLLEEENKDKYKRWNLVFPSKVVGGKTVDNLDKNIREFMAAIKKWFAVSVMGPDGKKRSYNIDYDEDKVNQYWSSFYGTQKESKLTLSNILMEMLKEEKVINNETENFPEYFLLKILPGGLETVDEGSEEVESRSKGVKTKKSDFIDAVIVKAGSEYDKKTGKIVGGPFSLQPGYANMEKTASDKESGADLNIGYEGEKVTNGTIKISGNPKGINELLNDIIKKGDMRIKKSQKDGDYIILYYPSQTAVGDRINNTWGEILK